MNSPANFRPLLFLIASYVLLLTPCFPEWGPDRRLTLYNSSYTSPNQAWCVAANRDTVHVVWWDQRDGPYPNAEIYYKRSTDGGTTWEPDNRLTRDSARSYYPSVCVSGSVVHVVWEDDRDGGSFLPEIYYKRSPDGGTTWGPDVRLTRNPLPSNCPSLAVSGSNVHVVWRDRRDGNMEIYYKRSTDGGTTWDTTDARLTADTAQSSYPSVAASGSDVHVVWYDTRGGQYEANIYYKHSTNGGTTWGRDTCLVHSPQFARNPCVAVSGSNVHVVWDDTRDGWISDVFYKLSTDGGTTWGPDINLTNAPNYSDNPSVAVSNALVHIVWADHRDDVWEIFYKRSTDGGSTWEPDTRLTFNAAGSFLPSVAVSDSMVHVVWDDERDGISEVYYKRNPTGNSGVEEETAETRCQRLEVRFKAVPNPFAPFASIPGHEKESFALYDIAGRRVGTYKGGRIGEGLSPGVYFLRPENGAVSPLRLVKLR